MKRRWLVLSSVGAALLASCYEPPRVYHVERDDRYAPAAPIPGPIRAHVDAIPIEQPPAQSAIPCSDLVCGDFTITGTMTAQTFNEASPVIVDGAASSTYVIPDNATTFLVYPINDTVTVVLPLAADNAGRIVRVKAMGVGPVDIHGAFNVDTIDGLPSYALQGMANAPLPSVTVQAFYDSSGQPGDPHHSGWAIIAVTP